jgi:hypothetical protein
MIQNASGKSEFVGTDQEQLSRLLELELAEKRLAWKRDSARYHTVRVMSFLFLSLVILGAMVAFFLLFPLVNRERPNRPAHPVAVPPGH